MLKRLRQPIEPTWGSTMDRSYIKRSVPVRGPMAPLLHGAVADLRKARIQQAESQKYGCVHLIAMTSHTAPPAISRETRLCCDGSSGPFR